MYSDGTQASSEDLVSGCASQTFKSCADVKIVQKFMFQIQSRKLKSLIRNFFSVLLLISTQIKQL